MLKQTHKNLRSDYEEFFKFGSDQTIIGSNQNIKEEESPSNSSPMSHKLSARVRDDLGPTIDEYLVLFDAFATGAKLSQIVPGY
jgi:hypothetical protein